MHKIKQLAFTLIELLVVIAVIGILSGLIVVSMNGVTEKATIAKGQIFSNSLRNSLMANLVSEWKFDETSGTSMSDSWSGGNTGTLTNFANTTAGYGDANSSGWMSSSNCVYGTCLKFDGSNDYINAGSGSNLNITGQLTISAWVKTSTSYVPIIGKMYYLNAGDMEGYRLYINSSNKASFNVIALDNSSLMATSTSSPNDGKWNYIVGTYMPSSYLKVYINGNLEATNSTSITSAIKPSTRNFYVGYLYVNGDMYLNGIVDDVRVYGATISTSQIKEQYYTGLNSLLINGNISKKEYSDRINKVAYE